MYQYFLGFDSYGLRNSFSYVIKNAIISYFQKNNISYTFRVEDDFEKALLPSGNDYFSFYAALKKKKVKTGIIAASNISDFSIRRTTKGPELILSLDALNFYRKADTLYITFPSQEHLIRKNKIETPTKILPITKTDYTRNLLPSQRDAFLRHYGLQGDRDIIVSYGLLSNKDTVMDLRAIATNCPEKDFLFFGEVTNDAIKQSMLQSITKPENIHFYRHLPEELYPSFLYHCKRLLLVGDYLAYPQILIDCICHKIPLISYKLSGYEEILNPEDAFTPKLYSQLYDCINKPIDTEKIENAYHKIQTSNPLQNLNQES